MFVIIVLKNQVLSSVTEVKGWLKKAGFIGMSILFAGCSLFPFTQQAPFIAPPLAKNERAESTTRVVTREGLDAHGQVADNTTGFFQTPKPPVASRASTGGTTPQVPANAEKDTSVASVSFDNMPLPQFVNAVYSVVLKRNVSIDPSVQQRTDLVSLRTGKPQTGEQLAKAAQAVLRSYGVAVNEFQGLVRVVPEQGQSGYLPEIRRGRAQPDVPASLRPVFYLVELENTSFNNAAQWVRTLYQNRVTVTEDNARNALLLSGQSDAVSAAMEALQLLDQPMLRGRVSARISPVFWSADEMAKRLVEVLAAEGYSASQSPTVSAPIVVLPIGALGSIVVFAANEQTLNHVLRWARDLDQTPKGRSGAFITYYVKNTDATDLAKTLHEVMGGTGGAATAKNVVVNAAANSLIIRTTPSEYQQWHGLLQELDRPARSALLMATVAEVRLTESEQFGFNWLLKQFSMWGLVVNGGTASSFTQPSNGSFRLSFSSVAGDPRALLTALASTNRIRILSNPSVVALNGHQATIQVGQEVPILTSQISNANTGSATGQGVLQTIQYRNTGVILKVKPVIHSGGRVDLEVSQEVSAAQKNETGVESSPVILTRKIDTRLSLSDGHTMLLGGLISENRALGDAGLPLLKDIPVAGAIFRTNASSSNERTELVVLLTPYIINDNFDSLSVTEAFRSQFGWAKALSAGNGKEQSRSLDRAVIAEEGIASQNNEARISVSNLPANQKEVMAADVIRKTDQSHDQKIQDSVLKNQNLSDRKNPTSKPYVLPENDGPSLTLSTNFDAKGQAAHAVPSSNVTIGGNSAVKSPAEPLSLGIPKPQVVTDEKILRELREAAKGR